MNLTLSQIHAELLRIYAHDLTPTNVLAVERMPNGDVRFETDTTELTTRIAEVEVERATDAAEYQGQIKELEKQLAHATRTKQ